MTQAQEIRLFHLAMVLMHPPASSPTGWSFSRLLKEIPDYQADTSLRTEASGKTKLIRDLKALHSIGLLRLPNNGKDEDIYLGGPYKIELARNEAGLTTDEIMLIRALTNVLCTPELEQLSTRISQGIDNENTIAFPLSIDKESYCISTTLIQIITKAIAESRLVIMKYRGLSDVAPRERTIAPHFLQQVSGIWYVIGEDRNDKLIKHFRVDRIEDVPHLSKGKNLYAKILGAPPELFADAAIVRPVIAVKPGLVKNFTEADVVIPAPSDAPPGWITLKLPAKGLLIWTELLCGYGANVKVIGPVGLKEQVIDQLRRLSHE